MRIAISATGTGLADQVDPRFGRCGHFVIFDLDTMKHEALDNSSATAGGGAGVAAVQMVVNKGVGAVLMGNCGPNAYEVLSAAGIQVMTGISGTVQEAIEGYRAGRFLPSPQPNVKAHAGLGPGGGT